MQKLSEVSIRRPVFATMLIMAMVVVGTASFLQLGVDRFPSVDLPTVSIRTSLPGAAPEDVETTISQPIEEAVNSVEGISELRSISGAGASVVIVTFNLERDVDAAAQDVRDKVAAAIRNLPDGVQPPIVSKFDNDSQPVLTIALTADRALRELTELADKVVKVQLERSDGVGEVRLEGSHERAINIWVEAERLAAYGIPIDDVREALRRQNTDSPGGNITSGQHEVTLRTLGRCESAADFDELVIAHLDGQPVRVRDIGRAEDGTKEQRSLARLNGVPAVILEVRRQSGANTVAVIEAAKANLESIKSTLPGDVSLQIIADQSRYIYNALHEIEAHLIIGSILASLVVLLFMRSWRSTIIAAIAIPTSTIATFGAMWALGFTLNSVTMLALVLMVGVVIDDAIVVLENIYRYIENKGREPFAAAREATAEIGLAVMATTFSLVVIFVPVSFMSSISGRFLYQFGFTAAVAVLISLLVSFTLTPMMSARLLRPSTKPGGAHGDESGSLGWVSRAYTWMLRVCLRFRWLVMIVAAAVIAASFPLYNLIQTEYIPSQTDEAEFDVNVLAPNGTSLAAMDEIGRAVEAELLACRGVKLVLSTIGGGFLSDVNRIRAYVQIAPHEERVFSLSRLLRELLRGQPSAAFAGNYSQRDVMNEARQRLRKFTDLRASLRNTQSFNIGGGNFEIDFVLRGPELDVLAEQADLLRSRADELGLVDADTTLKLDKPEYRVVVDRERAADLGVDIEEIAQALRLMVGGDEEVTRFRDQALGEEYDVQLRLDPSDRDDPDTISRLYVSGTELVRLDLVTNLVSGRTASRIDRLDRQRQVSLRAAPAPGYAQADRLAALRAAFIDLNLPPTYTTAVSGRARELERTSTEFLWAFALSIVFMYMILAAQFESFIHPLTILLSLPLSLPFALLSLWLTNNTLNLYSALGVLVLFGVVKKNAILQVDHANQLYRGGMDLVPAVIQASRDRLRPILMTTATLVAGMLPLAIGTGPGAEERRAVAVIVIGGQSLCLVLTLLVTPVAHCILAGLTDRRRTRDQNPRAPAT